MRDCNSRQLQSGDVIDMHQTIDGENLFLVLSTDPLDVRFMHDITRRYQDVYDVNSLLAPCRYSGEVDWEIVTNNFDKSYISNIITSATGCSMSSKDYDELVKKYVNTGLFKIISTGGKHPDALKHIESGRVFRFPSTPSDNRGSLNFKAEVERFIRQLKQPDEINNFTVSVNFSFIISDSSASEIEDYKKILRKAVDETLTANNALHKRIEKMVEALPYKMSVILDNQI